MSDYRKPTPEDVQARDALSNIVANPGDVFGDRKVFDEETTFLHQLYTSPDIHPTKNGRPGETCVETSLVLPDGKNHTVELRRFEHPANNQYYGTQVVQLDLQLDRYTQQGSFGFQNKPSEPATLPFFDWSTKPNESTTSELYINMWGRWGSGLGEVNNIVTITSRNGGFILRQGGITNYVNEIQLQDGINKIPPLNPDLPVSDSIRSSLQMIEIDGNDARLTFQNAKTQEQYSFILPLSIELAIPQPTE